MNERIRELAVQAMSDVREEAYPEERSWGMDDVMEKFAELIVKECAQMADDCVVRDLNFPGEFIKDYFGVK